MKPKLAKFRVIADMSGISDASQIDDDFIAAMVDSGWYDGDGSFEDFVNIVEGSGKFVRDVPVVRLSDVSELVLNDVAILGGSGFDVVAGDYVSILFGQTSIELTSLNDRSNTSIPYSEIESLDLSGGTDVSGGGFIGGGFGVEGAAVGMVAATLLNALSTRTTAYSQIVVTTAFGELFLLYDKADPSVLRIALSHTFTRLRQEGRDS